MYIALIVVCRKHANGGLHVWEFQPLRRAPLRVEDPRAETSDFSGSTPDLISYNKGQCTELWLKAVWARAIARRRLAREVGSGKKGGGLPAQTALELVRAVVEAAAPQR